MDTFPSCPISNKRIDEQIARLNGFFTFLLVTLFIITRLWYIPAFLTFDFLMRSTNLSKMSPISFLSRRIAQSFSIKKKLINAGPKIFAARIGLVVSAAIFIFTLIGLNSSTLILAGILALFSFLETAFGFCVACEIYPHVNRLLYKQRT